MSHSFVGLPPGVNSIVGYDHPGVNCYNGYSTPGADSICQRLMFFLLFFFRRQIVFELQVVMLKWLGLYIEGLLYFIAQSI